LFVCSSLIYLAFDIVLFVFRKICNFRRPHEYNCIIFSVIFGSTSVGFPLVQVDCLSVMSFCSLILSLHLCHLMTAFLFSVIFGSTSVGFPLVQVGCLSVLSFCSLILSLHLCHLMTAFLFSLTFLITLIFHSFLL
jgi:hypothetical protein